MFTGIVEKTGKLAARKIQNSGQSMLIQTGFQDLSLGESVAVNGVCLTVAKLLDDRALFYISPETLRKTALGGLKKNQKINLERALLANARLSGHWVQGHVDGVGKLKAIRKNHAIEVELPISLYRYCVKKGSIALDGISLTLNSIQAPKRSSGFFTVSIQIVPYTWSHTRLHEMKTGDLLNVEVDILGKYMEKLCQTHLNS